MTLESAQAPYQTVVSSAGLAAAEVDATVSEPTLLALMAANRVLFGLTFDTAVVGPLPKLPSPSTRHPQLLGVKAAGLASVPLPAGIELAPLSREVSVELSASIRVYPFESSV